MTNENAIKEPLEPIKVTSALNSQIMTLEYRLKNKPQDVSMLDYTIIEALKKQIPRKTTGFFNICPVCGEQNRRNFNNISFCQYCGQKLDWSEVDD